jgi:pilus assembly protein CpaF
MDVSTRPSLVIRKHLFSLSSLAELQDRGMMDRSLRSFLAAAVRARRNLIVTGGTGTGKTTLLRALINEVPRLERLVTIEDAYELGVDRFADLHPDHDALQARPANTEGQGEVTMLDLARMALRMDPDRVIIGEVRGGSPSPQVVDLRNRLLAPSRAQAR